MADLLSYKNFKGTVEYSEDDKCLYGRIVGIPDTIIYGGGDLDELIAQFKQSVSTYISDCKRLQKPVKKSYSGHFTIRIRPKTHERLDLLAHSKGTSVSKVIEEAVSEFELK